jgi:hypothetical protein
MKHKLSGFSLLSVAFALVLAGTLLFSPESPYAILGVYCADAYGNDIVCVEVYQNGSMLVNFTATAGSQRVADSLQINFEVYVKINSSLVASSAEAISYTRVNMSIMNVNGTYIWNNVPLNSSAVATLSAPYYWHRKYGNWTSSLPEAGVTYNCTVVYQAYF